MKNQRDIEELLADLLRTQDKQNEISTQHTDVLTKILNTQEGQSVYNKLNNELLAMIGEKIDRNNDARKADFERVNTKLDGLINEFKTIKPLIEKALDLDERVRKIEEHVFRKGA